MGPVLVLGHRNPDNDSICSAIAYAHLKNLVDPSRVYIPGRLGPVPPESQWVLRRCGLEEPVLVEHVRARVMDVMTSDLVTVRPSDSLRSVGALLRERGVRALPVVSGDEICGLVTVAALAARYVEDLGVSGFSSRPVTVGRVAEALDGALLVGDPERLLAGSVLVAAMEPETMLARIEPGDTLVVGDRRRTQPLAVEAGIGCLIVTGGADPEPDALEFARQRGCAVITTTVDSYAAARLLDLAHAVSEVMETEVFAVEPETLLSEAAEDLFASPQREAPVVEGGRLVGLLTRTNVARAGRREVILVDHNEVAQSADGVEEAAVLEIVDHHRIGDVQTASPITFFGLPVGATGTIVAARYRELEVEPTSAMATLMLSAILTDTVLLKSPTTTDTDRDMVTWLAQELDIDPVDFGLEMFRARSGGASFSAEEVVRRDLKEFRAGDSVIAVGQVETVDAGEMLDHRSEIDAAMATLAADRGYDAVLLMVTDIVREGTELIVAGRRRIAERAFGVSFDTGSAWFDGMLSRKKQVAPKLLESRGAPRR